MTIRQVRPVGHRYQRDGIFSPCKLRARSVTLVAMTYTLCARGVTLVAMTYTPLDERAARARSILLILESCASGFRQSDESWFSQSGAQAWGVTSVSNQPWVR